MESDTFSSTSGTSNKTALAVASLVTVIALVEWVVGLWLCGWEWVYPLDDTYIHVAIAKQIAESGTWGVEAGIPAFASSSPLWTLLLAAVFTVVGVHEWIPLLFSAVFGFFAVCLVARFWIREGLTSAACILWGLLWALVTPLVALVNLGMEHALHFLCVAAIIVQAHALLKGDDSRKSVLMFLLVVFAGAGSRYETLFVVFPVCLVFLFEKRFRLVASTTVAAILPMSAMGFYALSNGGTFFPVSLLLKTGSVGLSGITESLLGLYNGISCLTVHAHLLLIAMLVIALTSSVSRSVRLLALSLAAAIGGHLTFARLGWLYRYEAYLVGAGFMLLPPVVVSMPRQVAADAIDAMCRKTAGIVLAVFLAFPFIVRGLMANIDTVLAQREIHGQQVQMGRIFESLPGDLKGPIALNDLGYMALHAGVHVLDIWGLGSPDVTAIRMHGEMTPESCQELVRSHGIRYAAFYSDCYDPKTYFKGFRPVARLVMRGPQVVCAGREVLFCVAREEDWPQFAEHLKSIAPSIPDSAELQIFTDKGRSEPR